MLPLWREKACLLADQGIAGRGKPRPEKAAASGRTPKYFGHMTEQDKMHTLAQHVNMLYGGVRSLHVLLVNIMVISKAVRLTFASSPDLKAQYEKYLAEPLTKEEKESLDSPLQALDLMRAIFQRQFGPFEKPAADVN